MSSPKTKEQLTRLAWLTELRRQGHRQCTLWLPWFLNWGPRREKACALRILYEIEIRSGYAPQLVFFDLPDMEGVGALAGLSIRQTALVYEMNDGTGAADRKHTFAEIADVVAAWFPND